MYIKLLTRLVNFIHGKQVDDRNICKLLVGLLGKNSFVNLCSTNWVVCDEFSIFFYNSSVHNNVQIEGAGYHTFRSFRDIKMSDNAIQLLTSSGSFKHKVSSILNGSSDFASKVCTFVRTQLLS